MCDFLSHHDYTVILPDYFRGTFMDPATADPEEIFAFVKLNSDWNGRLRDDVTLVKEYALALGCERIGNIHFYFIKYRTTSFTALSSFSPTTHLARH